MEYVTVELGVRKNLKKEIKELSKKYKVSVNELYNRALWAYIVEYRLKHESCFGT